MQRISLPWILEVSKAIDGLDRLAANQPLAQQWYMLFQAKNQIEVLFNQSVYAHHLKVSRERSLALGSILGELIGRNNNAGALLTEYEAWNIRQSRDAFRTVFLSELLMVPSYLVSEKPGYDLNTLLEAATKLFPSNMPAKVPETTADALEAGKALAYELPTACGFHIFRVVEAVLKRYWDEVARADRPRLQTIGNFAAELEKNDLGEAKVWEALKQLARLHRNPLIHPEAILTVEEAIGILGMSRSVIGSMISALPDVPVTTMTAIASA